MKSSRTTWESQERDGMFAAVIHIHHRGRLSTAPRPDQVTRPWPSSGPRHGPTDTRGLAIEYSVTGSETWMASSRGKLKTNCSRRVISYELAKPMLKEC